MKIRISRKIVATWLVLCMMTALLAPAASFASTNTEPSPAFQDDFNNNMVYWKVIAGVWTKEQGYLTSPNASDNSIIETKGDAAVWQDQVVQFRMQFPETSSGGGFLRVFTRYKSDQSNFGLIIRPNAISYTINTQYETGKRPYAFETGKDYDIRLTETGSTARVEVKPATDSLYTDLGTISSIPVQSGKLRLHVYNKKVKLDEMKVYNKQDSPLMADGTVLSAVYEGETLPLQVLNQTGQNIRWSSSDPTTATVDDSGMVTGIRKGMTTIMASTVDFSSSVKFDVIVQEREKEGLLQFQDNFENGMILWNSVDYGSWMVTDRHLQSITPNLSQAEIKGASASWKNQTVSFKFKIENRLGPGFIGVKLRQKAGNPEAYTYLLIRPNGFGLLTTGNYERAIYSTDIQLNVEYEMKLVAADNRLDIYLKSPGDVDFVKKLSVPSIPEQAGEIRLVTYNTIASFSDVKVWNQENSPFAMERKVVAVPTGSSETLLVVNQTGKDFIWSSSDPGIATVDQSGKVQALKKGIAEIKAETTDGTYSDTASVVSIARVTGLRPDATHIQLYLGETQELTLKVLPLDADNKATEWTVGDPNVAEIVGTSYKARAIRSKGIGETDITVKTQDGNYTSVVTVTVTPPDQTPTSATLKLGDEVREILPGFFGLNDTLGYTIGRYNEYNPQNLIDILSTLNVQNLRGPGGLDANYYLPDEGVLANNSVKKDYYQAIYGEKLLNELSWMVANPPEEKRLYLPQALKLTNALNVPYIYDLNVIGYTPEEIVEQVGQIKALMPAGKELYLEFGNEIYDNRYKFPFPTVKDYMAKCKAIYQALHAAYPEIKLGIVAFDDGYADYIKADPFNQQKPGQSWEDYLATQGGRVWIWNDELKKDQSFYDALIIHEYTEIPIEGLSNTKLYNLIYKQNVQMSETLKSTMEQFPGKEAWITEWGISTSYQWISSYWEGDERLRARRQYNKSEGIATTYIDTVFSFLEAEQTTLTSYYTSNDSQGWGVVQRAGDTSFAILPYYYAMKELGSLFSSNPYFYRLDLSGVNKRKDVRERTSIPIEIPDVGAWGLGDGQGVKKVVLSNRTNHPINVTLDGYLMKPEWEYGGLDAIPDFLTNPNSSWLNVPQQIGIPRTPDAEFAKQVQIKPYAVTVVEVSSTPVTGVSLDQTSLTLNAGASVPLIATVAPENTTNKGVTWRSSNPGVATVDGNGTVTGVSKGMATITVTTADGSKTADCTVQVLPVLQQVILTADRTVLRPADTAKIAVSGIMSDGSAADLSQAQLVFVSDNELTTAVDGSGTVMGVKDGTAQITVSVTLRGVTQTGGVISFTVDGNPPVTVASIGQTSKNDWYNTAVTVTLVVYDNQSGIDKTEYRIGTSGDWSIYTEPVTFMKDGSYNLQYHSIDKAGNKEEDGSLSISIDQTLPTFSLTVNGSTLSEGETFEDDQLLMFTAVDQLSGVDIAKIIIGGTEYSFGSSIDLAGKPGSYTATITVEDLAGNRLERTFPFVVTTSIASMKTLMERFTAQGELTGPLLVQLSNDLDHVQHQLENGNPEQAAKHIEDFIKHLNNEALGGNISITAKEILSADANELLK